MRRVVPLLILLCLGFAPAPVYREKPGSERMLQIWLDPVKLAAHDLKPADVPNALMPSGIVNDKDHTMQVAWRGAFLLEVFDAPAQPLRWGPEKFGNVVLRATAEGEVVRLKDVARLRLRARPFLP